MKLVFTVVDQMARNTAFNLGPLLEKEKLAATGNNYADWVRNLRIVLRSAKKIYVLEKALPAKPAADASEDGQNVWATQDDDHNAVQCLMLACMSPELQKRFEFHKPRDMIRELDALYKETARSERFDIMNILMNFKMAEGGSVGEHIVKMIGYAERLKTLEFPIPASHMMDMMLSSLPPSYNGFVMNYNMSGMEKTPEEVLAMLKTVEEGLRKNHKQVLLVNKTASFKKKGKPKKGKGAGKTGSQSNSKGGAKNETECFYCKGTGHWKRNCKKYLADKKSGKTGKGIIVIQVNVIDVLLASENSKSWVFDTGSVAHICNSIQGL